MKRVGFRQPRDGVVLLCGTTGKERDECARCEQCDDSAVIHVEFSSSGSVFAVVNDGARRSPHSFW